jgi:pilus assembly protein CpaF
MPIIRRKGTSPLDPTADNASAGIAARLNSVQHPTGTLTNTTYLTTGPLRGTLAQQNHSKQVMQELKQRLHGKIIAEIRDSVDVSDVLLLRNEIERLFSRFMADEDVILNRSERGKLLDQVTAEILGYGPIQELLSNDSVSEIMVNGPKQVWIEQDGRLSLTDIHFKNDEHVMRIINRIVAPLGRHVDEASPMVDARLPDGSRVNVIIPPLSLIGPTISIRKFSRVPLATRDLVRLGSITEKAMTFLEAAVKSRLNMVVAGGTSTGKTTFLNVLSSFIPDNERIITIEDAAELQLQQIHVIPLEARPSNVEGAGAITIRELVINALRMRPDRIIVGECRGKEALDMLQAMNTGHDGSMTTIHSNGARDTLSRIETMVLMAGTDLPSRAIREQIASAFDLVVYMDRLEDGSRKITSISEIVGFQEETILTQEIFRLDQDDHDGREGYMLKTTGIRPLVMRKLERSRNYMPADFFEASDRDSTSTQAIKEAISRGR